MLDTKKRKLEYNITLSGFEEIGTDGNIIKEKYKKIVNELGGTIIDYNNSTTTHVVTPPNIKTMKAYFAMLNRKWLVNTDWLDACQNSGKFIECSDFGVLGIDSPIYKKKYIYVQN